MHKIIQFCSWAWMWGIEEALGSEWGWNQVLSKDDISLKKEKWVQGKRKDPASSFEPFPAIVSWGSLAGTNEEPAMKVCGLVARQSWKSAVRLAWEPEDQAGTSVRSKRLKGVCGKSQSPWSVMGWVGKAEMREKVEVHWESGSGGEFPISGPTGGHSPLEDLISWWLWAQSNNF